MEPNAQNLQLLGEHLKKTQDDRKEVRAEGEAFLRKLEVTSGCCVLVLKFISTPNIDETFRKQAAVFFKNTVKKYWTLPESKEEQVIPDQEREVVRQNVLGLLLSSPKSIKPLLEEAIQLIAKTDFHANWPKLIPEIVSKLKGNNLSDIIGVLEVMTALFERYEVEGRSDPLWAEINYVVGLVAAPFFELFKKMMGMLPQQENNLEALATILDVLRLFTENFFLLNFQDIPEFFESHMKEFLAMFRALLKYSKPELDGKDPDKPDVLVLLKGNVCKCLSLYVNKYDEDFKDYAGPFVEDVLKLLLALDQKPKYDPLVTAGISFLTSVAKKEMHKKVFAQGDNLKAICDRVIVPQLRLRESDIEAFESDPREYVEMDMEGSDQDTRRHNSSLFIRGLMTHFEKPISDILKGYIAGLLQQYKQSEKNWQAKDVALYLVTAVSVKGATRKQGATEVSEYVNVVDFFMNQVVPELKRPVNEVPILKADCLKFVSTFRMQLPPEGYKFIIPLIMHHLKSQSYVVHTYACIAIKHLLNVTGPDKKRRFTKEMLQPFIMQLLESLLSVLKHEESTENAYVLEAVYRVCSVSQETIAPFVGSILKHISAILEQVSANPRSPQFNHYLFEIICCLVTNICKADAAHVKSFESALFPMFVKMLAMESCIEFSPYIFQIIRQMLYFNKEVAEVYRNLFQNLFTPKLWENHGNVPALVGLLELYLMRDVALFVTKLKPALGVFGRLVQLKKTDHHGLQLISSIFEFVPMTDLAPLATEVFKILFQRLKTSKTDKLVGNLIRFFCLYVAKHGFKSLLDVTNAVQPQIFAMVLDKVWLPSVNLIKYEHRKVCIVAMTNMLTKSPEMLQAPYVALWPRLLEAVLSILDDKRGGPSGDDEDDPMERVVEGSSAAFAPLALAPSFDHDPVKKIDNASQYFVEGMQQLARQMPQTQAMLETVNPKAKQHLLQMMQPQRAPLGPIS